MAGTCGKCGQALTGDRCPDWCDVDTATVGREHDREPEADSLAYVDFEDGAPDDEASYRSWSCEAAADVLIVAGRADLVEGDTTWLYVMFDTEGDDLFWQWMAATVTAAGYDVYNSDTRFEVFPPNTPDAPDPFPTGPATFDHGCGHDEAEPGGCIRCADGERMREAERASSWTSTPDVPAVWRARVEPGAIVSWRDRSGGRRIRATVVDVLPDALIVDLWGVSRCRMTAANMPGLMVEVRPWPNGGPRYAPGALYGYDG